MFLVYPAPTARALLAQLSHVPEGQCDRDWMWTGWEGLWHGERGVSTHCSAGATSATATPLGRARYHLRGLRSEVVWAGLHATHTLRTHPVFANGLGSLYVSPDAVGEIAQQHVCASPVQSMT